MAEIRYVDRLSGKTEIEKVYGGKAIKFVYGNHPIGQFFKTLVSNFPLFSIGYGFMQKLSWSKSKIEPFVQKYQINSGEFAKPIDQFSSFNDFFIRKLKPEARPLAKDPYSVVMPADGRYLFYPDISLEDGFLIKGKKFKLDHFLNDPILAERYVKGTMVIARLCPTDYHRFHFPCDGIPSESRLINGYLYSVNPLALQQNIEIFSQNKRMVCEFESALFGKIIMVEVGATNVGSIKQTYSPFKKYAKGDEKGYFEFGGSSMVLLFEPGQILLEKDLVEASQKRMEMRCLMGQKMGSKAS